MIEFSQIIIIEALQKKWPDAQFSVGETYESLTWYSENINKPTKSEFEKVIKENKELQPMRVLREERNRKLADTDWRASSDLTLSSEWSTYRQALRDLPSTATPTLDDNGNLQNVTWPSEPT